MYELALQHGFEGLMQHAASDTAVFAFFAATGLFWQFRNTAVIGEPRGPKEKRYRLVIKTPVPKDGPSGTGERELEPFKTDQTLR